MTDITHIKLSDLTKKVADIINSTFKDHFWIVAEISGHKFYPNQDRHYFEFIEKEEGQTEPVAKVRGISWRAGSQHIKLFEEITGQKFTSGVQILAKVKVEYHAAHGLQLILTEIDHSFTLGNLEKQRRETLLKLVSENPNHIKKVGDEFFTFNKNIAIAAIIQKIAIIGSPNSEGYTDFIHTIQHNQYGYRFHINVFQSAVQGPGAENELVNRLIDIFESKFAYDAVLIIRGGGAKTDFVVFDTYRLARAIARFPIPIITGIGHHKDVSICDMMAHTSTKTPTKAAEFIIAHNRKFEDTIINSQKAVIIKAQQMLANAKQKVNSSNIVIINNSRTLIAHKKDNLIMLNQTIINKTKTILFSKRSNLLDLLNQLLSRPKIITSNRNAELNNIVENLKVNSAKFISRQNNFINHYVSVMKLMNPKNILKKGFAIVSQKGKILKDAENIAPGSDLEISMDLYNINAKVISKTKNNG